MVKYAFDLVNLCWWWADCYTNCCLCKLEFCCNWGDWMGLGWCGLAIQPHLLFPTWFYQIHYQICAERESLGSCYRAKGTNIQQHCSPFINVFQKRSSRTHFCGIFHILQIAFTGKKDFGKEERELKWAHAQRTLHGLHPPETKMFTDRNNYTELNQMAEEAKRRAEIARYTVLLSRILMLYVK